MPTDPIEDEVLEIDGIDNNGEANNIEDIQIANDWTNCRMNLANEMYNKWRASLS